MARYRKTKKGKIIKRKTSKRRRIGGEPYKISDTVCVTGTISEVNDDETVNIIFYDKSFSKEEVKNMPNSKVKFIKSARKFTVSPIIDIQPAGTPPLTAEAAPRNSRFRVGRLPSYLDI